MLIDDIPLFSMLKSRLGYLNQRQQLLAENVANSDTPGFTPRDFTPFTTKVGSNAPGPLAMTQVNPAVTNPAHLAPPPSDARSEWRPKPTPDSETRMDGNQVVLEEQMMKVADARTNYDAAIGFYEKSLAMIQLAIHTPGKGS